MDSRHWVEKPDWLNDSGFACRGLAAEPGERATGGTVSAIAHQLPVALLLRVRACRVPSGSGFAKPAENTASRVIRRPL